MGIFSEYTLMKQRKLSSLTSTEKQIKNKLYTKLFQNIRDKLIMHSG